MASSKWFYEGSELILACRSKDILSTYEILKEGADVNAVDWYGRTPLHYATQHEGWLDVVKELIDSHSSDPMARDNQNTTPLHYACLSGRLEVAKLLIETYKCNPQARDKRLNTPLHYACQNGWLDVAEMLIKDYKCDPEARDVDHATPVHYACQNEWFGIAKVLTEAYKCNPHARDKYLNTPLHYACQSGNTRLATWLLETCKCAPNSTNEAGLTPLHLSCCTKSYIITKLIQCGANPNAPDGVGNTPLHIACQARRLDMVKCLLKSENCDPNISNNAGLIPLLVAPLYSPDCIIKELVQHGAKLDASDRCGNTLLHKAVLPSSVRCWNAPHDQLIRKIISYGANPNVSNKDGDTPLHIACKRGEMASVKGLLSAKNCDLNIRNNAGFTPLHVLAQLYSTDEDLVCDVVQIFRKLLSMGYCANPNIVDNDGNTPLHVACQASTLELVQCILQTKNCDPNIRNIAGLTPLHVAPLCNEGIISALAEHGTHLDVCTKSGNTILHEVVIQRTVNGEPPALIIRKLIQCGAKPNVVNVGGDTPMHLACKGGEVSSVYYLLESEDCDMNIKNEAGFTPLHVALLCSSDIDLIRKLIKHGADPNVSDSDGNTPLHMACQARILGKVQCLLQSGKCDPNIQNKAGLTPLQVTPLYCNTAEGIIRELVQYGANLNVPCDCYGNTLLHKIVLSLQTEAVTVCYWNGPHALLIRVLIQCGANPNVPDNDGNTPLHIACHARELETRRYLIELEKNMYQPNPTYTEPNPLQSPATSSHSSDIIRELIQCGADPNAANNDGDTPLHITCKCAELVSAEYLLELKSSDLNIKNKTGLTALQVTPVSHTDLITKLVYHGANPKVVDHDGNTLLHLACKSEALDLVKYLLETVKCDPNCKNNVGLTPIDVYDLSSVDIVIELIRHGANPKHVYKTHGKVLQTTTPLQPPVKVFIVGNPSTGKSTLTASLKNESNIFGRFSKVSGVDGKTAGIDPHEFHSKNYGSVTLYDFAGQRSYYSSHAAVLRNAIQSSPPIYILVVDILENEDKIAKNISFWISFLNHPQCSRALETQSHLIIVGSHADMVNTGSKIAEEKLNHVIESLPATSDFHLAGAIPIDCRYPSSSGMSKLRRCLKQSSDALRIPVTISFNVHSFFIYLLDKFRTSTAVTVREIHSKITSDTSSSAKAFIPDSVWAICNICDELNDRGHILYLKDQSVVENSWVILNKVALLSKVTGTIFAPADFKQHCILASSTGVVPLSNISTHFPNHNIKMLIAFLYHLEYCREITDPEARSLIIEHHQLSSIDETEMEHSDTELYFLFPGLIRLDAPGDVWEPRPQYSHYFGWKLECQSGKFFTTRLLQVLILRLAFSFALAPEPEDLQSEVPAFQRRCSIWKSGIFWGDSCGVEALVEMVPTNDAVILLMRCRDSNLENLLQLRSNLIQKILGASNELCNRISAVELFADPSDCTQHPVKSMTTFGLKKVANAVIKEVPDPAVVSSTGSAFPLENLLIFDPYVGLGESILQDMFDAASDDIVSDVFLSKLAERLSCSRGVLVKLFKPNPTLLAERISKCLVAGPSQEVLFAIKMWRDGCNGTYSMLREKLDQFSIFAGRNPLILAGFNERQKKTNGTMPSESLTAVHLGDTGDELRSEPKSDKLLPNPPKGFKPTLQQLQVLEGRGGKRVRVMDRVAAEWEELAIALGFGPSDIDRLKRDYIRDAKGASRQVLTMWLNGESSHKDQPLTWATLIQCLIDAEFVDLAEDLNEVLGDDMGYNTSDQQQ